MKNENTINLFQSTLLEKITADIPDNDLWTPGAGHGHTAGWLLGHLAITGEFGQQLLGGAIQRPDWVPLFGPGSHDPVAADAQTDSKSQLVDAVWKTYEQLRALNADASAETLQSPHSIQLFQNTPITTTGQAVALILTNHYGFHLAQLSSLRRESGLPALF